MNGEGARIRCAQAGDRPAWAAMRRALWPDCGTSLARLQQLIEVPDNACFIALDRQGQAMGLAAASLRRDHVNGTAGSPAGFLEGRYVRPPARRQGTARRLVEAVARWTVAHGCRELASDAALDDPRARAAHRACGFAGTERVAYYRMAVGPEET